MNMPKTSLEIDLLIRQLGGKDNLSTKREDWPALREAVMRSAEVARLSANMAVTAMVGGFDPGCAMLATGMLLGIVLAEEQLKGENS